MNSMMIRLGNVVFAPLWSFVAVAGVDDKVDQKEWDAFTAELEDASSITIPDAQVFRN
jgi:hypothetical protein